MLCMTGVYNLKVFWAFASCFRFNFIFWHSSSNMRHIVKNLDLMSWMSCNKLFHSNTLKTLLFWILQWNYILHSNSLIGTASYLCGHVCQHSYMLDCVRVCARICVCERHMQALLYIVIGNVFYVCVVYLFPLIMLKHFYGMMIPTLMSTLELVFYCSAADRCFANFLYQYHYSWQNSFHPLWVVETQIVWGCDI